MCVKKDERSGSRRLKTTNPRAHTSQQVRERGREREREARARGPSPRCGSGNNEEATETGLWKWHIARINKRIVPYGKRSADRSMPGCDWPTPIQRQGIGCEVPVVGRVYAHI